MSLPVRYFGPHNEPAVLVERFEELRDGMVVWVLGECPGCPKTVERHFVLGDPGNGGCACCGGPCNLITSCDGAPMCLCPRNVADRVVFAVILEPPANTETRERRKELVDG